MCGLVAWSMIALEVEHGSESNSRRNWDQDQIKGSMQMFIRCDNWSDKVGEVITLTFGSRASWVFPGTLDSTLRSSQGKYNVYNVYNVWQFDNIWDETQDLVTPYARHVERHLKRDSILKSTGRAPIQVWKVPTPAFKKNRLTTLVHDCPTLSVACPRMSLNPNW